MPYSSVSGVISSPRITFSQPGMAAAFSMLKRPVARTSFTGTPDSWHRMILAVEFRFRTAFSRVVASASEARSVLLSRITSANSSWSIKRSATLRSSCSSTPVLYRSNRVAVDVRSPVRAAQSTTVTQVSSLATSWRHLAPTFAISSTTAVAPGSGSSGSARSCTSKVKVSATCCGSLTPEA